MHICQEYDQSVAKMFYIQVTVEHDEHVEIEHINFQKLNSLLHLEFSIQSSATTF